MNPGIETMESWSLHIAVPGANLRRAHSCITIPAATASGSEWFTP
jgi:hypothetical protein